MCSVVKNILWVEQKKSYFFKLLQKKKSELAESRRKNKFRAI